MAKYAPSTLENAEEVLDLAASHSGDCKVVKPHADIAV
jgi:hypothetical protein